MDREKLRRLVVGDILISKLQRIEIAFASASTPFHAEIKQVERDDAIFQKKMDAGQITLNQPIDDTGPHKF